MSNKEQPSLDGANRRDSKVPVSEATPPASWTAQINPAKVISITILTQKFAVRKGSLKLGAEHFEFMNDGDKTVYKGLVSAIVMVREGE